MTRLDAEAAAFLATPRLWTREQVLARPSPVPSGAGVYGWWFSELPTALDTSRCQTHDGAVLLYTGISPRRPAKNGAPDSKSGLRKRIRTHYAGNAAGSTLRKTLGCLLADALSLELRRVGRTERLTLGTGESRLSAWMSEHARVSFVQRHAPWELEDHLIAAVDLPLNLAGNALNAFHPTLTRVRADAVDQARRLPVLPNPGVGGR